VPLPTREQCLQLLKKHKVLENIVISENIVRHSLQVGRIAAFLAEKLKAAGEQVGVELVGRSSILHAG